MNKEYYEVFKQSMKEEYSKNKDVLDIIEHSNELDEYGEFRVALENMLENIIENDIKLSMKMIELADKAFGNNKSEYNKKLIDDLKNMQWIKQNDICISDHIPWKSDEINAHLEVLQDKINDYLDKIKSIVVDSGYSFEWIYRPIESE